MCDTGEELSGLPSILLEDSGSVNTGRNQDARGPPVLVRMSICDIIVRDQPLADALTGTA